jgi:hypothetical protein
MAGRVEVVKQEACEKRRDFPACFDKPASRRVQDRQISAISADQPPCHDGCLSIADSASGWSEVAVYLW